MTHRQFWLQTWAEAETFVREKPQEARQLERKWREEDPCLRNLVMDSEACREKDPERRKHTVEIIDRHWSQCGRCRPNVMTTAETAPHSYQRAYYRDVVSLNDQDRLAAAGLLTAPEERAEGIYFSTAFKQEREGLPKLPFVGIERFCPSDPNVQSHWILELSSKEQFENPNELIQHLDGIAAEQVQVFPTEATFLHWRPIIGDEPEKLLIRWEGQVKEVAEDWGLYARYRDLIRRYSEQATNKQKGPEGSSKQELGETTLTLEETARAYNREARQKAWFMGFLKSKLRFTAKEARRQASKDPLVSATPSEEKRRKATDGPEPFEEYVAKAWPVKGRRIEEDAELSRRLERIQPHLSANERETVRLLLEGLSAVEIAKRLKCRRETVSRYQSKIRTLLKQPPSS